MTFTIQEGQIFLFANEHSGTKKPHFKGSLMFNGVEAEFAVWPSKSGKEGSYSGKITAPYKPSQDTHNGFNQQGDVSNTAVENIDEIPF
jgi:hypothetical protein